MRIYYSGAEIPAHRKVLAANGIERAALSYMGLRRRTKMIQPWNIQEKIKEPLTLLLDSGGHTVNAAPQNHDVPSLMASYEHFVQRNATTGQAAAMVERVLEFDALVLGPAARRSHRERLAELVGERFIPVWHKEDGAFELRLLASRYGAVAVADLEADGRDLTNELKAISHDAEITGLAMLKPDRMAAIPFFAVTGTSWLSPSQHGETVIYAGGELHRYHKQYQDEVRRRYRTQIIALGLDAQKVQEGDREELLSLSLRSWQRLVDELVAKAPVTPSQRNGDPVMHEPDNDTSEMGHESTPQAPRRRARQPLPGLSLETKEADEQEEGKKSPPLLRIVESGALACNSCYVKGKCPGFEAGASCLFESPVSLRSLEEIEASEQLLEEIALRRLLRAMYFEEIEGGYPDGVVSGMIDQYDRLRNSHHRRRQKGFSVHVSGTAPGTPTLPAGIISNFFARDPAPKAIEPPVPADPIVSQIMDAEVVSETEER
jgi:hypothetical protein